MLAFPKFQVFARTAMTLMTVACGCAILDDDEPSPIGTTGGEDQTCKEAAEQVANCEPPYQWWFDQNGGHGQLVAIDDPAARVTVGPNAWLMMITSSADYVGTHTYNNGDCHVHCGWCEAGQVPCLGGSLADPECLLCLPFDHPTVGEQCATFIAACLDGESLDETGAETSGYDCTAWHPEEAVQCEGSTVTIDARIVDEILFYDGAPLATCDDTRIRARPDGYFEISQVTEHGLLASIGLMGGDILSTVDDLAVNNLDAVMTLAGILSTPATHTVTVERNEVAFQLKVVIR